MVSDNKVVARFDSLIHDGFRSIEADDGTGYLHFGVAGDQSAVVVTFLVLQRSMCLEILS